VIYGILNSMGISHEEFEQVRKNKENKELFKNFETWKKQAKEKINLMKKGKLTENEVYEWILENK